MLQETGNSDCKPLPSLVICPPTLTGHWVYEVEKFVSKEYLKPLHYTGPPSERQRLVSGVCPEILQNTAKRTICRAVFVALSLFFFYTPVFEELLSSKYLILKVTPNCTEISRYLQCNCMVSCLSFEVRIILRTCGNGRCLASSTFLYG